MKKMICVLSLLAVVSSGSFAKAESTKVCMAGCLISVAGYEATGSKLSLTGEGATTAEAIKSLKAQCDSLAKESDKASHYWGSGKSTVTGFIFTDMEGSAGGSVQGTGRFANLHFDANKACIKD